MKKFFYRVSATDSVLSVSQKFAVPITTLIKLNNLKEEISNGDLLYVEIPQRPLYTVQPFESATTIGEKFGISPQKILQDNGVPYLFYGLTIML